jgi:hypothetical protein
MINSWPASTAILRSQFFIFPFLRVATRRLIPKHQGNICYTPEWWQSMEVPVHCTDMGFPWKQVKHQSRQFQSSGKVLSAIQVSIGCGSVSCRITNFWQDPDPGSSRPEMILKQNHSENCLKISQQNAQFKKYFFFYSLESLYLLVLCNLTHLQMGIKRYLNLE